MTQAIVINKPNESPFAALEQVLIRGDLSALNEANRVQYYQKVCETVGLNPLTKPFEYITLNGKLVLYALRAATEQLRKIHNVSVKIVSRETIEGVFIVTAQAKLPDGREDESIGAVHIAGLKGELLANAFMKAETKAKRRITLSICGLGLLDETEVEDAQSNSTNVFPDQPAEGDGIPCLEYFVPYGPCARKPISKCDPVILRTFIEEREAMYKKSGRTPGEWFIELVKQAEPFIAEFENGISEVTT